LIIEGEEAVGQALTRHFAAQGYTAQAVMSGKEGLALAQTARPDLILLAARLPDMAGEAVFRALRDQPRTGHIPVMFMAGQDDLDLQKQVLEAGAYDFIEKPLDLDILTLRVRNALRRFDREGLTETHTGLPTGRLIEDRLRALDDETGWFRIDLAIAEFGVFRDLYGFVTANEALRFAGNLIVELVNEHGTSTDFVGHHNGSEEFVIVTTRSHGPRLVDLLRRRLNEELKSFYNFMDREQGYVMAEDGTGGQTQKPLMSARLQVTQDPSAPGPDEDPWMDVIEEDEENDEDGEDDSPDTSSAGDAFDW